MATIGDVNEVMLLAVNDWIGYDIAGRPSAVMLKEMIIYGRLPFAPKKLMDAIGKDIETYYEEKNSHVVGRLIAPQILHPKSIFLYTFVCNEAQLPGGPPQKDYSLRSVVWIRKTEETLTWRYRRYRTLNHARMATNPSLENFGKNPVGILGAMQNTAKNLDFIDVEGPNLIREGLCVK